MVKSLCAKLFASVVDRKNQRWIKNPISSQKKVLKYLIKNASNTVFGKDHHFDTIKSHSDFVKNVPIRDYESFSSYISKVRDGKKNILWKGKPLYLAKTSGTTSGIKYIPLTKESIPHHIKATRDALLSYIHETGNSKVVNGKMIFLQGSPKVDFHNGIGVGRLSGIVAHYVPSYLKKNRLPSWNTNCIEDWESKVEHIITETLPEKMSIISGIPSWVQMYFEKLIQRTDKKHIKDIFEEFELFIYGGVNYGPYKSTFDSLIGKKVDSIEIYPASEGFFAYQDTQKDKGLLLLLDAGIFYEFVPVSEYSQKNPRRLSIEEVQVGENYLMIISTDAGLWAYNLGDTVSFISKDPYRLKITGRIKHFISAFGEHVISHEVERALEIACRETGANVTEFTLAPMIESPLGELPYHEWFIEFNQLPSDLNDFAKSLDQLMQKQNIYYKDLITGKILQPLKIRIVEKNGFSKFMKQIGKLGGQNKVQRVSNDRNLVSHPTFNLYVKS